MRANNPLSELRKNTIVTLVLPFVLFLIGNSLEPMPPSGLTLESGVAFPTLLAYPLAYSAKIAAISVLLICFWPSYSIFLRRVHYGLSVATGVLGAVVWIGLCRWQIEARLLETVGLADWVTDTRAAFDPYTTLGGTPAILIGFLIVRLFGLVLVVPLIEELFLRGFLVRYVIHPDWENVQVGMLTPLALVATVAYAVLSHPGEILAAACWFPLISLLLWKTRSLWDAVVAHATTNLLLGVYVLVARDWALW